MLLLTNAASRSCTDCDYSVSVLLKNESATILS